MTLTIGLRKLSGSCFMPKNRFSGADAKKAKRLNSKSRSKDKTENREFKIMEITLCSMENLSAIKNDSR